ncbi:unnamed protein product [Oncorhynchus mykiss]|uniref:TRPM SLOG domain-containing protein n=1 Tax=Oncorhynchus mykiss TaxID=8022 RepID=A0A061AC55_ONCMY|nr:unnamed protein product [Oncorhynchus mykiss]
MFSNDWFSNEIFSNEMFYNNLFFNESLSNDLLSNYFFVLFACHSKGICKCGHQRIHHVDDSIKPENYLGETWDRHRHVHEVPTDAYGDIWFGGLGQKIGKYVRVSSDTSPDLLYQLLTEQWKLPPPNLLISVTGGAKNFYMKPHLTALFRRGLIKVAQTTGTVLT